MDTIIGLALWGFFVVLALTLGSMLLGILMTAIGLVFALIASVVSWMWEQVRR